MYQHIIPFENEFSAAPRNCSHVTLRAHSHRAKAKHVKWNIYFRSVWMGLKTIKKNRRWKRWRPAWTRLNSQCKRRTYFSSCNLLTSESGISSSFTSHKTFAATNESEKYLTQNTFNFYEYKYLALQCHERPSMLWYTNGVFTLSGTGTETGTGTGTKRMGENRSRLCPSSGVKWTFPHSFIQPICSQSLPQSRFLRVWICYLTHKIVH